MAQDEDPKSGDNVPKPAAANDGSPPTPSGGTEAPGAGAQAGSMNKHWLDIGKTVIAGVITAGIIQFIKGGRR